MSFVYFFKAMYVIYHDVNQYYLHDIVQKYVSGLVVFSSVM